jgi:hypothetical protein
MNMCGCVMTGVDEMQKRVKGGSQGKKGWDDGSRSLLIYFTRGEKRGANGDRGKYTRQITRRRTLIRSGKASFAVTSRRGKVMATHNRDRSRESRGKNGSGCEIESAELLP